MSHSLRDPTPGEDVERTIPLRPEELRRGTVKTIDVDGFPVTVTVPPGMDPEHVLRLDGQGRPGRNGGPAGALWVTFTVADPAPATSAAPAAGDPADAVDSPVSAGAFAGLGLVWGAVGGILGWLLLEYLPLPYPFRPDRFEGPDATLPDLPASRQALVGLVLGLALSLSLAIGRRLALPASGEPWWRQWRAVFAGTAGGYVGLFVGQLCFAGLGGGSPSQYTVPEFTRQLFARSLGWLLFGMLLGLGQQLRRGARAGPLLSMAGGASGGLMGGVLFQLLANCELKGAAIRFLGFLILGSAVGFWSAFGAAVSESVSGATGTGAGGAIRLPWRSGLVVAALFLAAATALTFRALATVRRYGREAALGERWKAAQNAVTAGQTDEAIRMYSDLSRDGPSERRALARRNAGALCQTLAVARLRSGQAVDAERYARAAVQWNPELAPGHYVLGQSLAKQNRVQEALSEYDRVVPAAEATRKGNPSPAELEALQVAVQQLPEVRAELLYSDALAMRDLNPGLARQRLLEVIATMPVGSSYSRAAQQVLTQMRSSAR